LGTHARGDLLLRYNRAFNEATQAAAPVLPTPQVPRDPTRRLRVGYLSSDFNAHATAMLMVRVFELRDKSRFECFAYSYGARVDDSYRTRLKNAFERWRDINDVSDEQAAAVIAGDGIDVLVELKGHTYGARLGITDVRPAPIQLHYLGFPGSVARSGIDYIVADHTIAPHEHGGQYAERVLRLPRCYQANDPLRLRPNAVPRRELGLPDQALVLCNFNATYKLREAFVRIWLDALSTSPNAVLWLLDPGAAGRENLLSLAREFGCSERLIFAPRIAPSDHLARLAAADLALDQLPCSSHTTGADALWMGVPMLTCLGESFHGRVGASLLKAVDLPEFVTPTLDRYAQTLKALLTQPAKIFAAKQHLKENYRRLALFDAAGFTADWEQMLQELVSAT
jgi:protein O-GlcNAc transferase